MAFLDQYADHGLQLTTKELDAWDPDAWAAEEQQAAADALAMLTLVSRWPRRLGADATREELAHDKRFARRLAWTMRGVLLEWGGDPEETGVAIEDAALRRQAAQVDLGHWCAERKVRNQERCTRAATICRRGLRDVGNRFVQRYLNEQKHLDWAER